MRACVCGGGRASRKLLLVLLLQPGAGNMVSKTGRKREVVRCLQDQVMAREGTVVYANTDPSGSPVNYRPQREARERNSTRLMSAYNGLSLTWHAAPPARRPR